MRDEGETESWKAWKLKNIRQQPPHISSIFYLHFLVKKNLPHFARSWRRRLADFTHVKAASRVKSARQFHPPTEHWVDKIAKKMEIFTISSRAVKFHWKPNAKPMRNENVMQIYHFFWIFSFCLGFFVSFEFQVGSVLAMAIKNSCKENVLMFKLHCVNKNSIPTHVASSTAMWHCLFARRVERERWNSQTHDMS